MPASLRGASIVIVGGSSGIGLATATMAREHGAHVTIAARDADRLKQARDRIGGDTQAIPLDVADEDAVRKFFASVAHVDHLATLAGAQVQGRIVDTQTARLRHPMEVRFWGSLYLCKYAAPRMSRSGSITLTSGVVAERPWPERSLGTASTAAVEAFARAMAVELAPIRVNTLRPGIVDTPMTFRAPGVDRDELLAAQAKRLPVGRVGSPDDLAHAILFLMQNSYVTGVTLTVDGGHLLL